MRNIALRFAGVLLCLAASGRAAFADFRTDSLATLCTVWSEVKFHHPHLLLREVDWDGALVRAIPKVREAQTSDQVAQAIGAMLAELGDPVTRVSRQNGSRPAAPVPLLRWDGDVLIVSIGPYRDSVTDEALLFVGALGAQITPELSKAKGVVFDFRTERAANPGTILGDFGILLDNLILTSEPVAVPPRRRVFHSGYVPGPFPGAYYSALQVLPSPPSWSSGEQGGLPARYVFIVGEELPDQAAALWWSGHAAIVAEAAVLDDRIARARTIDLGGGWSAAVRVSSIEGRFVVTGKAEELPRDSPIAISDEIVSIDGEPLEARVRRLWKYFSGSNEAGRTATVLSWAMRGPHNSVAELVVRGADGSARTVNVARTRSRNIVREGETWRLLDGNIGYVDLTRLTVEQVDAMFTALNGTEAIVFDMRGYPNGLTTWSVPPRLNTRHAAVGAIFRRPQLVPAEEIETQTSYSFAQALPKIDRALYGGRTVMLIDERTYSQAEWTGLLFEAANGTKFIGSNSAGAVGDKTYVYLPGGIEATFTGHDVRHADGRPVQGIGLVPDVRVEPTVAGIRAGRDEVLERAVVYLGMPPR